MAQSKHSQYTAADGGLMTCDRIVLKLQWFCQGCTFYRDTKVMQLPMYDIILGAD
jgi:bifunctional pyridoxal-dependent enzyme with beta-cystathionase and maltose regulon repressor activities